MIARGDWRISREQGRNSSGEEVSGDARGEARLGSSMRSNRWAGEYDEPVGGGDRRGKFRLCENAGLNLPVLKTGVQTTDESDTRSVGFDELDEVCRLTSGGHSGCAECDESSQPLSRAFFSPAPLNCTANYAMPSQTDLVDFARSLLTLRRKPPCHPLQPTQFEKDMPNLAMSHLFVSSNRDAVHMREV
jgi:hypothetical protein